MQSYKYLQEYFSFQQKFILFRVDIKRDFYPLQSGELFKFEAISKNITIRLSKQNF
jgi:type VI protein secretion system component VasA